MLLDDKDQENVMASSNELRYAAYESEEQLPLIMRLIAGELSEPYSIYTYRYFLHAWPDLSFLAMSGTDCIGVIVCKLDLHRGRQRGYIAMLAVRQDHRKRGIGTGLVKTALAAMRARGADEASVVVLETEITNKGAQGLYENLGFMRDKLMTKYYLNGNDAYRLKLWLKPPLNPYDPAPTDLLASDAMPVDDNRAITPP
ncbi:N-alpha-acetyltransferase 30 [Cladochytrium tenue]|nr:N-alpha-acetyltransferase 30 [Cladochytrium tenue]